MGKSVSRILRTAIAIAAGFLWLLVAPQATPRTALTEAAPNSQGEVVSVQTPPLPPDWAHRVLSHLTRRGVPMETEELRAVLAAVDRVSKRLQLDPLTILAVIEVESRFDPTAVSRKGARGLMQLRLETARALAREMGIPWTTDDRVFEPELNVVLGASYLGRLVERFGSLDAGLAAFHSGPGRIESRRARDGSIPLEYANRVGEQVLLLQARASL